MKYPLPPLPQTRNAAFLPRAKATGHPAAEFGESKLLFLIES